jgi:hypothetical protein
MKTINKFLLIISIGLFTMSCKKERVDPRHPTLYSVSMTDAPGDYTAVNIDIQSVEVKGSGQTVILNVIPGIYNLLDFTNGVDTMIATGLLYVQTVQEIRLILGNNNTVVKNGVTYPLSTPSAQQSGLKIKVHQDLLPNVPYHVLLDFDADASIVVEGNGSYSLKPVIRKIDFTTTGSITGYVSPAGITTNIIATSGSKSFSTMVNANGYFLIPGVPAGIYNLTITPAIPYNPITIQNINAHIGNSTNVGTINL